MPSARRSGLLAAGLVFLAAPLLFAGLGRPAFFDNEGRYAEMAREMLILGDYVTPHLNFAVFLNKPPLLAWLTALYFHAFGLGEGARLWSALAGLATLALVCHLGCSLWGLGAGLVAAAVLLLSPGFLVEARTLRPDLLLTACVTAAIWCWWRSRAAARPGRALAGFYVALGLAVLDKGLVGLVLPAMPIGLLAIVEGGWRGLGRELVRLRPLTGGALLAAVVVPWHALAAYRNPGFLWDYLVNQHLLFFFDLKLPRDSVGDSLLFFWGAFLLRAFPWCVLLPLSFTEAVRGLRVGATGVERATLFCWGWAAGVLVFFSLAPSRLEHYTVPALPAAALLVGRVWQRGLRAEPLRGALAAAFVLLALAAAAGAALAPGLLGRAYWLRGVPGLLDPAPLVFAVLAAGLAAAALAAAARRAGAVMIALGLATAGVLPFVYRALVAAEPLFSWRPLAIRLLHSAPSGARIVFEAPEEYQLCGGLNFYTRRRVELLRPPGFVAPTYLARAVDGIFLDRGAFAARWRSGEPLVLVSDPLRHREGPEGLAPGPARVLGHFGDRWLLTNVRAVG